jgi:carbon monoxide dehydrogenase subunit G
MPSSTARVTVPLPPTRLGPLLRDLEFVASLLPQVTKVEKTGETTALWTVRLKIGPFSKSSVYRGELVRASETAVDFEAEGDEARIRGAISIAPAPPSGSEVQLTLEATGKGTLAAIVNSALARRLPEEVAEFTSQLQRRAQALATGSGAAAAFPGQNK